MATARDSGWFRQTDGTWARNFGVERIYYVTTAYVRLNGNRYEIGTGNNGKPDAWKDYCGSDGFHQEQEYKAKRRATAMAKRILKGFK